MNARVVRCAVALCAGAVPLGMWVGTAHADTESRSTQPFTFTKVSTGQPVTCTVEGYSIVFGSSDDVRRDAFASTKSFGEDPSCTRGSASVAVTYRNSSGVSTRGGSGGDNSTYWTGDDVGSGSPNLVAVHEFSFADCASSCSITFATAPK